MTNICIEKVRFRLFSPLISLIWRDLLQAQQFANPSTIVQFSLITPIKQGKPCLPVLPFSIKIKHRVTIA
ncbi:hypothetical protein PRUPE_5G229300 [Prunus persica]|uniref:Uncharacterized protein n=1 Tax=Prunus persica TaxID=3760 RepID=A0A251PCI7_PRUPE|nr:hypothetical protein PRUPE_5G229300 [Prunus persica]